MAELPDKTNTGENNNGAAQTSPDQAIAHKQSLQVKLNCPGNPPA